MTKKQKSLCVYCGSRMGDNEAYGEAAKILGRELAKAGIRLVYGGGKMGLMGTVAGAARDNQGAVFGIIPEFLVSMEGVLEGVDHTIVQTMHERKIRMFEEADAFCTLPGGIGTLEEIIELMSWTRLQLHRKPLILLNINEFWSPLVTLVNHVSDSGFADPALKHDLIVVDQPEAVIPAMMKNMAENKM